ncbi:hypothetical protein AB1Y20_017345 [Prymnesium parvum]|uniref:SMP-30/Gluconolactonase/LRE-like region domain-containing protein n=1 Tax=Prymnesium parvum TaxID=97485 RepID=A0AB34JN48_PRYPA
MELCASGNRSGLCSPVFVNGKLMVCARDSGEVCTVQNGALLPELACGAPSALCADGGAFYICDMVFQGVLRHEDGQLSEVVKEYEAKMLLGPSSIAIDEAGNVFFLDSGPLGETTLADPKGSAFQITADAQLLQPLALECLAHPSALAIGPDQRTIYITEMMTNRVLRLVQRAGVFHSSVFYQFSGRMGPSGVACCPKTGKLYVSHYDFASTGAKGLVSIISSFGKLEREIEAPAAELTGIALSPSQDAIFVTEASTNSVYTCAV